MNSVKVIYVNWITGAIYFKVDGKNFFYKKGYPSITKNFNSKSVKSGEMNMQVSTDKNNHVVIVASDIEHGDQGFAIIYFNEHKISQ